MKVAISTHVNADGDGAGSGVALWHLLQGQGIRAAITNPTPFPETYTFLLDGFTHADKTHEAVKYIERADAVVVLDISDVGRLGHLASVLKNCQVPVACIDHHHVSNGWLPEGPRLVDPEASATGELIYDLARALNWEISSDVAHGLYVAIMTDTGGFRFSNTTPRSLNVAAHLLDHGLAPEDIYRNVYASVPEGKLRLLAEVLDTLVVERKHGLAWITVPAGALERHGIGAHDLEGVVEYPRSIRGVRLAILFRPLAGGRIKVSFRSIGDVDVSLLAGKFGGGGHRRAAGAAVDGKMPEVQAVVLKEARDTLS